MPGLVRLAMQEKLHGPRVLVYLVEKGRRLLGGQPRPSVRSTLLTEPISPRVPSLPSPLEWKIIIRKRDTSMQSMYKTLNAEPWNPLYVHGTE
jgi:hypothetical protein